MMGIEYTTTLMGVEYQTTLITISNYLLLYNHDLGDGCPEKCLPP